MASKPGRFVGRIVKATGGFTSFWAGEVRKKEGVRGAHAERSVRRRNPTRDDFIQKE